LLEEWICFLFFGCSQVWLVDLSLTKRVPHILFQMQELI
jgi:hypothetical protein